MSPYKIEKVYLERLKKMTGEEKMRIASGLFETVKEIAKAGIRAQNPGLSEQALREELRRRLYK